MAENAVGPRATKQPPQRFRELRIMRQPLKRGEREPRLCECEAASLDLEPAVPAGRCRLESCSIEPAAGIVGWGAAVAATADQLRSWAEVDALREFMRDALVELARTHPRLFQTVDSDTVDVSNDHLSGKQVFAHFLGEAEAGEAREEKRLQHLLKARFAHFLLTSEGRGFLESVLLHQLEEAQLLDG